MTDPAARRVKLRDELIAKAVAEARAEEMADIAELIQMERETIAQAIEAERQPGNKDGFIRIMVAARIARDGGRDD